MVGAIEACALAAGCISAGIACIGGGIAVAKVVGRVPLIAPNPERVVKKEPESLEGYGTLEEPFNEVRKLLLANQRERDGDKVIKICGMIGTGKTTIMANLNDDIELGKEYDIIIWLDVSSDDPEDFDKKKNIGYEQLRVDVMERLKIDRSTVGSDKEKIKKFLKNKKYLLLLDNVKATLDLDEIGFPRNWERKGSKVVLTTRRKGSFLPIVDSGVEVVEVEKLDWEESIKMFFNISGLPRNTEEFHQLIKRCGYLPIVIKLVAGRFKTVKIYDELLKDTIYELNSWPEIGSDIVTEIRKTLSFCCEDLKDEEKLCFYYGALYPEGSKIHKDRLLDCWIAEEIEVRNRADGRLLLRHFQDRNLFEKDGNMFIKMHALIRILALHNLQTDGKRKFLVGSNHVSSDQNDDSWKEKHWISLANCYGGPFPDSPDCSELSTLFLQENSKINMLPEPFFKNMRSLRVLDLTGTSIESLPCTLKDSKKLAVLYLNKCTKLSDLSSLIGNLENLEVLDITGCELITQVPQIEELKNLKRFLVSSHAFSETGNISRVISKLTKLNELLIDTESEKKTFDWEIIKRVIDNVKTLENITSLQFQFLHDEIVVVWERVDDERKFFGHSISQGAEMRMLFQSYFDKWIGREPSSAAVKLFSMSDAVEIIAVGNDPKHLDASKFSNAAAILVGNCQEITYILGPSNAPSSLEQLYLNDMEKLKSVTHGLFHLSNFGKLKILKLYNCPQLTNIITKDAMKDAEEDMPECSTSAVQKKSFVFPELMELVLVDLPNLVSIWKNELLEFPSLIEVEIRNCPALKYLPISRNNTQKLKSIKTTRTWWGALLWEDPAAETYFQDIVHYVD